MAELGHEKYNVVGWSDGAISGVIHAARHPERVEKLVIFGGNAFFDADDIEVSPFVKSSQVKSGLLILNRSL